MGAWGFDCAAVAFGGAARQSPLVSFPFRVSVSPQGIVFASPSDHTSLAFVSLLFFGSSVSLSKAVGRTEVDCAGGFGVLQRSPLLISSPPKCLSLLAKSLSNLLPTAPLDFPSLLFLGLPASRRQLGSRGLYAPGSSGAVTQPPSVSSPSEWLSLLAKSTFECPSDRTSRFPLASLPRFASRRRLGARWLITPGARVLRRRSPLWSVPHPNGSLSSRKSTLE